ERAGCACGVPTPLACGVLNCRPQRGHLTFRPAGIGLLDLRGAAHCGQATLCSMSVGSLLAGRGCCDPFRLALPEAKCHNENADRVCLTKEAPRAHAPAPLS